MSYTKKIVRAFIAMGVLALAACQPKPPEVAIVPPPIITPPPPPPKVIMAPINLGISDEEQLWHMRAALNVAALKCRGTLEGPIIANYNNFLKLHDAALDIGYEAEKNRFRLLSGKKWQAEADSHLTKVYNFFSSPQSIVQFCMAANDVASRALTVPTAELVAFSKTALAELEEPVRPAIASIAPLSAAEAVTVAPSPAAAPSRLSATMAGPPNQ